eukprot:gene2113-8008_t
MTDQNVQTITWKDDNDNSGQHMSDRKWKIINGQSFVAALTLAVSAESMVTSGLFPISVTSITRQFGYSNTQVGVLQAIYDSFLAIGAVSVTHFGHCANKPRWCSNTISLFTCGVIIMVLLGALYAPPFSTSDAASINNNQNYLCSSDKRPDVCDTLNTNYSLSWLFYIAFIICQIMLGVGASAVDSLGVSFIDDNINPKHTSLYISLAQSGNAIGAAIGFLVGSTFLSIYVTLRKPPMNINENSPNWVGAWWIGMLLAAGLCVITIPWLRAFPKNLPGSAWIQELRRKQAQRNVSNVESEHSRNYHLQLDSTHKTTIQSKLPCENHNHIHEIDFITMNKSSDDNDFERFNLSNNHIYAVPEESSEAVSATTNQTQIPKASLRLNIRKQPAVSHNQPTKQVSNSNINVIFSENSIIYDFSNNRCNNSHSCKYATSLENSTVCESDTAKLSAEANVDLSIMNTVVVDPNKPAQSLKENSLSQILNMSEQTAQRVWHLLKNRTFAGVSIGYTIDMSIISGLGTFLPGFVQNQFYLTAAEASLYSGIAIILGMTIGTFLGGALLKRTEAKQQWTTLALVFVSLIGLATAPSFLLTCGTNAVAGINTIYPGNSSLSLLDTTPWEGCDPDCHCSLRQFVGVCHRATQTTYLTPCSAGCRNIAFMELDELMFVNCSCVAANLSFDGGLYNNAVHPGICKAPCKNVYPFLFLLFITMVTFGMSVVPTMNIQLRCVAERDRSFSLGLGLGMSRLVGSVPGRIIFGVLIDQACLSWETRCNDERGSCLLYDNQHMANALGLAFFSVKTLSTIAYSFSWYSAKRNRNPHGTELPNEYILDSI